MFLLYYVFTLYYALTILYVTINTSKPARFIPQLYPCELHSFINELFWNLQIKIAL